RTLAAAAARAAVLVAGGVRLVRAAGDRRRRLNVALFDVAIAGTPFVFAFCLWAAISWVIVGHPFEQFSSVYGAVPRQLAASTPGARDPAALVAILASRAADPLVRTLALQPALAAALVVALVVGWRRRDWSVLAVPAILGAPLAFVLAANVQGVLAVDSRYLIWAVPLG